MDHAQDRSGDAAAAYESAPVPLAGLRTPGPVFVAANAAYRALVGVAENLGGRPAADGSGADGALVRALQRVLDSGRTETCRVRHVGGPHGGPLRGQAYDVTATPVRAATGEIVGADLVGHPCRVEDDLDPAGALPTSVAVHPALALSAQVALPAGCEQHSDWFDTLSLPDGRLAVVLGDVPGRGATAAATVSRLRGMLPLALSEDPDPGRALARMTPLLPGVPEAVGTTVVVLVAEAPGDRVAIASAGHSPAVLVSVGGELTPLMPGGGSLGVASTYPVHTVDLAPGDLVLLVSDGLVEAARRLAGVPRLVEIAREVQAGSVDDLDATDAACHELLQAAVPADGFADDAVVVAVRRRAWPPGRLATVLPAIPDTVTVVRHELADWCERVGLGSVDTSSLLQAVAELVANAVEHAYPPGTDHRDTQVSVSATLDADGRAVIEVGDAGRWHDDPSAGEPDPWGSRGRGLYLARAFVDRLVVDRTPTGTRCRIEHRPARPVTVLAGPALGRMPGPPPPAALDLRAGDGRLIVSGPVDLPAADRLRVAIGRASQGETRPLEVDLSAATLLSSSAIGVLIDSGVAEDDRPVTVRADAGSPAAGVLRRVGLIPR